MKRKGMIASAVVLLALGLLLYFFVPRAPKVHASFPETLSAAQRKEIPMLVRKETGRRVIAFLQSGQLKAAWGELRSARSHKIIAVAYQPNDTNKVWVYIGHPSRGTPSSPVSMIYPMTNVHGHWKITNQ